MEINAVVLFIFLFTKKKKNEQNIKRYAGNRLVPLEKRSLKYTSIEEFLKQLISNWKRGRRTRDHLSILIRNTTRSCQLLTELNTVWVSKIINISPKASLYRFFLTK